MSFSEVPQAVNFFKPWVERITELSDEELEWMAETFGTSLSNKNFDENVRNEATLLLHRLRDEVPLERATVHHYLNLYP